MSFWSSLASGLTSMIPGVGPFIAPLVGGAIGGLTSGGGGGGSGNVQTSPLDNPQIKAMLASLNKPTTMDPATKGASDYYNTILHGGQDATTSLLAPEVSTVMNQYDNASRAAAEMGPRGAGRAAIQAETPFKKSAAYVDLLGKAKSTAGQGLAGIGATQTAAQTARRGQDVSTLGTVLGGQNNAADLAFRQQQEKNKQIGSLGSGIGSILTNILGGKGKKDNGFSLPAGASFAPQSPYEGSDTGD